MRRKDRPPQVVLDGLLTIGGARLECRRIAAQPGSDNEPTLVLLHEGLGCVGLWKDFPDRLAAATGLGVFLWSRAGFGRSDPVPLPRPLDYLEQEAPMVGEVLAAAGIQRSILVGHSDGGTIALLHAANGRADGIAAIVTVAAHVFVEDVTIAGIHETRGAWEQGDLRERLARWHGANVDAVFHGWCDTWLDPAFRSWNIERHLPGVRVPVLALQGKEDQYGTPAQVEAIARRVSGPVEAMILPGASHLLHVDAPYAVIAAITRFFRGRVGPLWLAGRTLNPRLRTNPGNDGI
jgi:pimeloyl-ACP methyl ester carboxylesterase